MATILVVDDEVGIRELLSEILSDEGHAVVTAENAAVARQLRVAETPDLVLLDIWMPDTDGVTLLKEWASNGQLTVPVIMMSGHATIDTAVEATRFGALDFLEKPIALARLLAAVKSGLERGRVMRSLRSAPPTDRRTVLTASGNDELVTPDGVRAGVMAAAGTPAASAAGVSLDQPLREARDQ